MSNAEKYFSSSHLDRLFHDFAFKHAHVFDIMAIKRGEFNLEYTRIFNEWKKTFEREMEGFEKRYDTPISDLYIAMKEVIIYK